MGCTKISLERVVRVAVPKGSDHTSLINTKRKDGLGRQGIGTDNKVCKQAPCLTIKKKFQNNLTNKIGYVIMDI